LHSSGIRFSTIAVIIDTDILLDNLRNQAKLVTAKAVALVTNMVDSVFLSGKPESGMIKSNSKLMLPPMPRKPSSNNVCEEIKQLSSLPKKKTQLDKLYEDFDTMSKMFSGTTNAPSEIEGCEGYSEARRGFAKYGDKRSRYIWNGDNLESSEPDTKIRKVGVDGTKIRKVGVDGIIQLSDLFHHGHSFS